MKNASSRNKFLLCFRPVVDMDLMLESNGCGHTRETQAFKCKSLKNKSSASDHKCSEILESNTTTLHSRPPKRTLPQVIKTVQFQTLLAKKVRERKSLSHRRNDSFKSKRSVLEGIDMNIPQTKCDPVLSSNLSSSSLSSVSSLPSTNSISSEVQAKKQKIQGMNGSSSSSCFSFWTSLLVIISLTLTIIWGRVCAIMFTSIWLYLLIIIPHRQSSCRPEDEKKLIRKGEAGFTCS